jgi:endonuclease-3 related protein
MLSNSIRRKLMAIYRALRHAYGPQHWWPGDTPFEVMVGAVLTQNTAWVNVEKAIANQARASADAGATLSAAPPRKLASLIRPSGYYNIKAGRLRRLLEFILSHNSGSLKKMFAAEPSLLRSNLLGVHGIGPETAGAILRRFPS